MQRTKVVGVEDDVKFLLIVCVTGKTEIWFVESYKRVAICNFVRTCVSKNAGVFLSS
jgi:hypothetical protein